MRKFALIFTAALAAVAATAVVSASPPASKNFNTHLSGAEEVPARDTLAQGHAHFKADSGEQEIGYRLIVANIENVAAAHIHCGVPGMNGPVGVTLFSGTPGSGSTQGVIAHGAITAPDAGNACGWVTVQDIIDAMLSGDTYVNVHTNDGVAPADTGPGDFPGGEIRGQLDEHGPS